MSKILLGVSGGIAIFKVAQLMSNLSKKHEVKVIMTENAEKFMSKEVFQTLSKNKVYTDTFQSYTEDGKELIAHIELAKWADIIVLAPATANLLGKLANGIADDLLTTTLLAARSAILFCPAMNTYMLNNPASRDNFAKLNERGIHIMETESGDLACGDFGNGKLARVEDIERKIEEILLDKYSKASKASSRETEEDLRGLKVLVTAGPTQEALDPVRFISNHSSGKMGYAVAEKALSRGADVTLISGPVNISAPLGVSLVQVNSAEMMFSAVRNNLVDTDILVMSAAVSDYRPENISPEKIKKNSDELIVRLVQNPDILAWAGKNSPEKTVLCGFAMETENLIDNAREKLLSKKLDLIVANNLKETGAGFATDTNVGTIISRDKQESFPLMSKKELAEHILDYCIAIYWEKNS